MAVKDHKLFTELLERAWGHIQPQIDETIRSKSLKLPWPRGAGINLSPKQEYEYNCYYWCKNLVEVFDRLENIVNMSNHSLYKKKNEEKSVLLFNWIQYNYEYYVLIYQSIPDIASMLINEIYILGIPRTKCSCGTVCENTRIKGTRVHKLLGKLQKLIDKHRKAKNLLLHQGDEISLPIGLKTLDIIELTTRAVKHGCEVDADLKDLVQFFLEKNTKEDIIKIMSEERSEIETQVENLYDVLLPFYRIISEKAF